MAGRRSRLLWVLTAGVLVVLAVRAPAGEYVRSSGTLVAIERDHVTLATEGPWGTLGGRAVTASEVIALQPETRVAIAHREVDAASGLPAGFVTVTAALRDLRAGDLVTVESVRQRGRLLALTIVSVRPEE